MSSLFARIRRALGAALVIGLVSLASTASAGPLFQLVGSQPGTGGTFDILPDGRLIGMSGDSILVETAPRSGVYTVGGRFESGLISPFGASFISLSPDGSRFVVGDGNFGDGSVFLVNVAELNGGLLAPTIFDHENYAAVWYDSTRVAISGANRLSGLGEVSILDLSTTISTPIVTVRGASAGIGFDSSGNLFTGNGFDFFNLGRTGEIRAFDAADVLDVLEQRRGVIEFETSGSLIGQFLSAGGLTFDDMGHVLIGGGDFGKPDIDYFALADSDAVLRARQGGAPLDRGELFIDDPDPAPFSFYDGRFDPWSGEWIVTSGGEVLYRYVWIPTPGAAGVLLIGAGFLGMRRRRCQGSGVRGQGSGKCSQSPGTPMPGTQPPPHSSFHFLTPSPPRPLNLHPRSSAFIRGLIPLLLITVTLPPTASFAQTHAPVQSHVQARIIEPSWFATRVIDYSPAPGQFVNDPRFNDPARALGPPVGGGTIHADLSKLVTLGGFGGSITLGFDRTVRNDPRHPMGLDFIVFGNAIFVGGDPNLRWAEAGVIEIQRDHNHNGIPDGTWYVIPGSSIADPYRQRRNGQFILPDNPFASPPIANPEPWRTLGVEAFWGYADMTPVLRLGDLTGDNIVNNPDMRPEDFYTVPSDPLLVGITSGSGGGDAFDISWAVDPVTNQSANLDGFDFIRITTAVDAEVGWFGEVSVEIGGVAIVRPGG